MKSLRNLFMSSYILTILVSITLSSAIALYYINYSIEYHSAQALNSLAAQKATELNSYMGSAERAAMITRGYIQSTFDKERFEKSDIYRENYVTDISNMLIGLTSMIHCIKACYFAFDAQKFGGKACRYFIKTETERFFDIGLTISEYPYKQTENIPWYYEILKEQTPLWMGPYTNIHLEDRINTISYALPLYHNNECIGVVGMDVDVALLRNVIDNLDYEMGFGFLVKKDGTIMYHKDFPSGLTPQDYEANNTQVLRRFFTPSYCDTGKNYPYIWNHIKQRIIVNSLNNGMFLAISIPESELLKLQSRMILNLVLLSFVVLGITSCIAHILSVKIIKPIQLLTKTATHIARGEFNTPVTYHSDNELGLLAENIGKIASELKEYIEYTRNQAYSDAMTGISNKTAYLERVQVLEQRIDEHMADFAIYVFDVNELKHTNDAHGHEFGDLLIKDTASILKSIFAEKSIFRIGGDEFVVLDESSTLKKTNEFLELFDKKLEAFNLDNKQYADELTISKGVAIYDETIDKSYADTFARADEAMYACKSEFYKKHTDRRRR